MKNYLSNLFGFICALLLAMLVLEIILNTFPSEFKMKSNYLERNKDDVNVLFLGSSHTQKAVNPEYISHKAINLAHVGQSLDTDLYLLKKMIKELNQLQLVVIELSYHILEEEQDGKKHWRNHLYLKYYNLNKFERPTFFWDKSLIYSNPKFFLNQIVLKKRNEKFNNYGYNLNDINIFKGFNYDSLAIKRSAQNRMKFRHKEVSLINFNNNLKIVNEIIEMCESRNIRLIVQIPPVYKTYRDEMIDSKRNRLDSVINILESKAIPVLNHEKSDFDIKLFSDDDHLNEFGAESYSRLLDKEINLLDVL